MNVEEIREYCISMPEVTESFPFDEETLVFKAKGKMFLLLSLTDNPVRINVKCDPEIAVSLRDEYACILPGYHMNKKHWNTIILDGTLGKKLLKEQIDASYALVAGAKVKSKSAKK
jgi:predicted DNA-binding protein (MmcQ/YjbR family)